MIPMSRRNRRGQPAWRPRLARVGASLRGGNVTSLAHHLDLERAFTDVDLAPQACSSACGRLAHWTNLSSGRNSIRAEAPLLL
jgi:hypothetical protein